MKILITDDSATDVAIIRSILSDSEILVARNGKEAADYIRDGNGIDLLLLDLHMPVMDGFEVLSTCRGDLERWGIVTLILTNANELESEIRGLELGAVDYIRKPLNFQSLRKRIEIHHHLKEARRELQCTNDTLERTVRERTDELLHTREITIHALSGLLETRNLETGNHTKRTQYMMKAICEELRAEGKHLDLLTDAYIENVFSTAPLHDIGKVGIPDAILLKPGRLTPDEFEKMKEHVSYGLKALEQAMDETVAGDFVKIAIEIIATHHEWYDGTGYPKGLSGDAIPLSGRMMAIVDVYDALVSKRVYKAAISHGEAVAMIASERGTHFDPDIVDAFLRCQDTFRSITHIYQQA